MTVLEIVAHSWTQFLSIPKISITLLLTGYVPYKPPSKSFRKENIT